jgi:hypothetical protein
MFTTFKNLAKGWAKNWLYKYKQLTGKKLFFNADLASKPVSTFPNLFKQI